MSDSNSQFDDALLSAFVDDELTAEQRQAVEQHLASDASARQLVAELRELSATVSALPREDLPFDLSDRVVQRLAVHTADTVTPDAVAASPVDRKPHASQPKFTSGWLWGAVAIAATVLIAVMIPRGDDEMELADAGRDDDTRTTAAATEDETTNDRGLADGEAAPGLAEAAGRFEAVEPSASASVPAGATGDADAVPAAPMMADGAFSRADVSGPDAAADESIPVDVTEDTLPIVIELETTRTVLERQEFDKLLGENGIVVDEEPLSQIVQSNTRRSRIAQSTKAFAAGESGQEAEFRGGRGTTLAVESLNALSSEIANVDEAILVEASTEQLLGCLSDISDNMTVFRNVSVDPRQAAEPLRRQVDPVQQKVKFSQPDEFRKWAADLGEGVRSQQAAAPAQRYDKGAPQRDGQQSQSVAKSVDQPATDAERPTVEAAKQEQFARAQVLYSNNFGRVAWAANEPIADDADTEAAAENAGAAEADTAAFDRFSGHAGLGGGGFGGSRQPVSGRELSAMATDASNFAVTGGLADTRLATEGLPRLKVLFLLKAPPQPPAAAVPAEAAEAAPADE